MSLYRNLSFDISDDVLKDTFAAFGELEYALAVKDRDTGRARGTGFVKFKSREDAAACLERMEHPELVSR